MTIHMLAPAKINLGLEVIRKRDDGFHDIATVFQTISIFDRLSIEHADANSVQIVDRVIQIEANLAAGALDLASRYGRCQGHRRIEIEKRIPIAAGLGGASTDAAAVLAAIAIENRSSVLELAELALQLGSDVPFLLRGGAAHATGRGEILETLTSLRGCWIVLASPDIEIERKTAQLYAALRPTDFSDGHRARRVAKSLSDGLAPSPDDLANVFGRPLGEILPQSRALVDAFEIAGAPFAALTGAGPTQYTIVPLLSEAISISRRLSGLAPCPLRVLIGRPVATGIQVREDKTRMPAFAL